MCEFQEVTPGLWKCPVCSTQIENETRPLFPCPGAPPSLVERLFTALKKDLKAVRTAVAPPSPPPPKRGGCNCRKNVGA
jgi:hypothetical protein